MCFLRSNTLKPNRIYFPVLQLSAQRWSIRGERWGGGGTSQRAPELFDGFKGFNGMCRRTTEVDTHLDGDFDQWNGHGQEPSMEEVLCEFISSTQYLFYLITSAAHCFCLPIDGIFIYRTEPLYYTYILP